VSPEHYNADELNEPFELRRKTRVSDGAGGFTETEATQGGHFAKVRPLRGGERQIGDGTTHQIELLFVVYAGVGVRPTDVLVYNGLRYDVRLVQPAGLSNFQEVEAASGGPV
jgi:head-tail joining protein